MSSCHDSAYGVVREVVDPDERFADLFGEVWEAGADPILGAGEDQFCYLHESRRVP